jgi:hypothetical protein
VTKERRRKDKKPETGRDAENCSPKTLATLLFPCPGWSIGEGRFGHKGVGESLGRGMRDQRNGIMVLKRLLTNRVDYVRCDC